MSELTLSPPGKPKLSPFSASEIVQVSDTELGRFASLIYDLAGIRVSPQKKMLLSNRLRRRLRETKIESFDAYYHHLRRLPAGDPEWNAFLQEITTHETYLFRDTSQWEWFSKVFLPERIQATKTKENPSLRVWSAACSTGDEVFTIAACIAGTIKDRDRWNLDLLGTDIGVGSLRAAREAVFGKRAMHRVSKGFLPYFEEISKETQWRAKPVLRKMTRFAQHNLLKPLRGEKRFDLVFLKNVLIYFDTESKKKVAKNLEEAMRPGALLVTGAAEGVGDLLKGFEKRSPWLYRRK